MIFKDALKDARKSAGLTQRELADKSNLSYSYVTKLESGEAENPTLDTVVILANTLKVSPAEFLEGSKITFQPADEPRPIGEAYWPTLKDTEAKGTTTENVDYSYDTRLDDLNHKAKTFLNNDGKTTLLKFGGYVLDDDEFKEK
jgi:transcriptional regulator with XRE-family HTH domain